MSLADLLTYVSDAFTDTERAELASWLTAHDDEPGDEA